MSQINLTKARGGRILSPLRFTYSALNNHHYPTLQKGILSAERIQRLLIKDARSHLGMTPHSANSTSPSSSGAANKNPPRDLEALTPAAAEVFPISEAKRILDGMMASTSQTVLRFAGWFLHIFLGRIFPKGVFLSEANLVQIQELSRKGSVVFLPTHKSYFDFILVTFACYANHIQAPFIAAGDNFRIPFIGWLARKLGAFFIRRRLEGTSQLYKSLLAEYVTQIVESGANLEFFIEGARSRSGRIMYPKFGLLSRVVEASLDGKAGDVYLVPVGISFERLLDTGFPRELLGVPKVNESLYGVVTGFFSSFFRQFGATHIQFGEPVSVVEFVELFSRESKDNDSGALERQLLTRDLGVYAIKGAQRCGMITNSCLVSFLLLTKFRFGVKMAQLTESFDILKKEIASRDYPVCENGPEGADPLRMDQQVQSVLILIPHLITVSPQGDIAPSMSLECRIELLFYGNQLFHVFWGEALVLLAALSTLDDGNLSEMQAPVCISKDVVESRFEELLDLLNKENVIMGPFEESGLLFKASLWELSKMGLLSQRQNEVEVSRFDEKKLSEARMLLSMIRPCIDSCYFVYEEMASIGDASASQKEVLERTQQKLISLWKQGELEHGETCSLDLLKRGLEAYQRMEPSTKSQMSLPVRGKSSDSLPNDKILMRESSFYQGSSNSLALTFGSAADHRGNVAAKYRINIV